MANMIRLTTTKRRQLPSPCKTPAALKGVETGANGADTLKGTKVGELPVGLGGDDMLDGNDELRGGDGDETCSGGDGSERFVFASD